MMSHFIAVNPGLPLLWNPCKNYYQHRYLQRTKFYRAVGSQHTHNKDEPFSELPRFPSGYNQGPGLPSPWRNHTLVESSRSFWEICSSSVQATDLEHTPRVPMAWENRRLIIIMTHNNNNPLSSAYYGSGSIYPKSFTYICSFNLLNYSMA